MEVGSQFAELAAVESVADSWVNRIRLSEDTLTTFPVRALAAALDRPLPAVEMGQVLPPLWHWLYFLPVLAASETRHDGHAKGDDFLPPIPLPRRVWAGSRFEWVTRNPLCIGQQASRVSRISSITPKTGRSGALVFVETVHEFRNPSGLSLVNTHRSVYREAARPDAAGREVVLASVDADWHRVVLPDPVLLFRYSALTFNTHRIHYDQAYATGQEGYPALLVQGPLIATLLLDLLARHLPQERLASLELRSSRSLYVDRPMTLRGRVRHRQVELWAADDEGRLAMTVSGFLQG
jgi:3-methylfumaryl-CoA hydratase